VEADLHTQRAATPTQTVMKLVASSKKLGKSEENNLMNPLEFWEESSLGPILVRQYKLGSISRFLRLIQARDDIFIWQRHSD